MVPIPTPRSAATQAPPLVSEHGQGGGFTPAPPPKAPPKKVVPVKAHTRAITIKPPAPVVDPVTAQVTAAQLPQTQAIRNNQDASALAATNAATGAQGYNNALAEILKGVAPAVQGSYQSAAANDSAFGKGFSTGLAHIQSQTAGEAQYGAGISGGTAQTPADGGTAATDALYGLGGYLPASTLEREGAGAFSAASRLPATALGQGAATIAGIGAQQRQDQAGYAKQLEDLAAQAPGLRLQFQGQADTNAANAASLAQRVSAAAALQTSRDKQQKISYILATGTDSKGNLTPRARSELASALGYDPVTGKPTARTTESKTRTDAAVRAYNLSVDKFNAKQTSDATKLAYPDATISRERGYFATPDGNPILDKKGKLQMLPGFKVDANGTVTKTVKPPKAKPPDAVTWPNLTKAQVTHLRAGIANSFYGFDGKDPADKTKTKHYPPLGYEEAINHAVQSGFSRAGAVKMANRFYMPGQHGRPKR